MIIVPRNTLSHQYSLIRQYNHYSLDALETQAVDQNWDMGNE